MDGDTVLTPGPGMDGGPDILRAPFPRPGARAEVRAGPPHWRVPGNPAIPRTTTEAPS